MKKFWIKFSIFLLFSLVLPVSFIAIRFKLFSTARQLNTITLWAVIALCVLIGVVSFLIKFYLDGMKCKHSLLKQILQGAVRVLIPIFIMIVLVFFARKILMANYETMLQTLNNLLLVLGVCFVSETIAIIVNPLPEWAFNNNVDGMAEIYDKIKNKGGEGD